ncbi:hypothetical protein RB195_002761 [Necator americanus]|uniref:Uncharacterized protein n=1 Tax=Necator americanus TaxID=51031 RepID=A0ABR1DKJ2_NECAM
MWVQFRAEKIIGITWMSMASSAKHHRLFEVRVRARSRKEKDTIVVHDQWEFLDNVAAAAAFFISNSHCPNATTPPTTEVLGQPSRGGTDKQCYRGRIVSNVQHRIVRMVSF